MRCESSSGFTVVTIRRSVWRSVAEVVNVAILVMVAGRVLVP